MCRIYLRAALVNAQPTPAKMAPITVIRHDIVSTPYANPIVPQTNSIQPIIFRNCLSIYLLSVFVNKLRLIIPCSIGFLEVHAHHWNTLCFNSSQERD